MPVAFLIVAGEVIDVVLGRNARFSGAASAAVLVCLDVAASGNVINVPADQPTIQAGINAAATGDVVMVAPGTYNEAINFNAKAIVVRSTDGPAVTTIDASGLNTSVVTIPGCGCPFMATLDGFTITGGAGTLQGGNTRLGGGVYVPYGSCIILNCRIINNTANGTSGGKGGGICMLGGAGNALTVRNCLVEGNVTTGASSGALGGGIYAAVGSCSIIDCIIQNNQVIGVGHQAPVGGGGVMISGGSSTIVNCTIDGNVALGAPGEGAGIRNTGSMEITNSRVTHNYIECHPCSQSSGVFTCCGPMTMRGCTVAFNTIGILWDCVGPAGGVWKPFSSTMNISDSIVYGNTAAQISVVNVSVSYSCVQGGFAGIGNVNADPMFADSDQGDFRVLLGSPCIDVGSLSTLPSDALDLDGDGNLREYLPIDIAGSRRIVNGFVDMGAFEWQHACISDISPSSPGVAGDGTINAADLLTVINAWGPCDGCVADVNGDGLVNVADLLAVINGWGACP